MASSVTGEERPTTGGGRPVIALVVGTRPNFIKAAPLLSALDGEAEAVLIHTGQHYDFQMSRVFFRELGLPDPDHHLEVGSRHPARQVGEVICGMSRILPEVKPDACVVFGDTNSCLGGALGAVKSGIPVAHVESGLRSFNISMPEEINRMLIDRAATWRFCPSATAVKNLEREGIRSGVHLVGDIMIDSLSRFLPAIRESAILKKLGLQPRSYLVATFHRQGNVDSRDKLANILRGLAASRLPVVIPLHPRSKAAMERFELRPAAGGNLRITEPLGYVDFLALVSGASLVVTDSGGIQKEAFTLGIPCVTMRGETEWVETVEAGWNILVKTDKDAIAEAINRFRPTGERPSLYGVGRAAEAISDILLDSIRFQGE